MAMLQLVLSSKVLALLAAGNEIQNLEPACQRLGLAQSKGHEARLRQKVGCRMTQIAQFKHFAYTTLAALPAICSGHQACRLL
jgi:hypothetical protein